VPPALSAWTLFTIAGRCTRADSDSCPGAELFQSTVTCGHGYPDPTTPLETAPADRAKVLVSLHRIMAFAEWVGVRQMVFEIALAPKQTFWTMTVNLLLDAAVLEWAKVFGSY
jgi:hypothetical protein